MKKNILLVLLFIFFGFFELQSAANDKFVVVIDAGHGGKDGGAVRGTKKEKDINLGVALALGKLIEANMNDVKIIYTRKTDVFIDLYKRSEIANKAKANLFISIHTNSTASKITNASGADTYILGLARSKENLDVAKRENSVILYEEDYSKRYEGFDPNSPESNILFEFMTNKYMDQSLEFATFVQKGFSTVGERTDRGVAQAGFLVLRESGMPSVLIELGFINNPLEASFLVSKSGQHKMASSIFYGFKRYKEEFDKRQGNKSSSATSTAKYVDINIEEETDTTTTENNEKVEEPIKQNIVIEKQVIKKPKVNTPIEITYRVQFLISNKKLSANSSEFKGLSPVDYYIDKGTYKYTYGAAKTEAEALKIARSIRPKFKDAFVLKFENGIRAK